VVLAFAVDNPDEILQQLKSQGVAMTWGVKEDSDSRWVMFNDPGGNLVKVAMMGVNAHHK
jgi:hypothetical protein